MNEIDKFFSQFIGQSQGQGRFLRLSVEDNLVGGTFIGRKGNQDYLKVKIDGLQLTGGGGVQSVTGLNTNNSDPKNPIVQISIGSGLSGNGTPSSPLTATGSGGTVISVGGLSPLFTVTNPTTTPTFSQISQTQNLVFASPNGSSGNPTFRALVASDIPSLSYVTSVGLSVPTGFSVSGSPVTSSGTLALSFAAGYSLPTNTSQTNWDTAYTNRITSLTTTGSGAATLIANVLNIPTPPSATFVSLTTTGSSGSSTLSSGVLNVPTYTLSGLGGQPLATNLTSLSGLTYASLSFVKMSAAGTFSLDTNTYLTANQTITLSGEATGSGTTSIGVTLTNSAVIGKVLTGYVSGAGTVAATDSILEAIQKLNGNIGAIVSGVSSVSGTTNRITSTGGATPVIDISASYVGQSSITTVSNTTGITTGAWKATIIDPTYGGTGVNNSTRTITVNTNNAIFDFSGAFTLTVPATGTAALGTGASNRISYWSGTNTVTSSANFTYDGTTFAQNAPITANFFSAATSNAYIGMNSTRQRLGLFQGDITQAALLTYEVSATSGGANYMTTFKYGTGVAGNLFSTVPLANLGGFNSGSILGGGGTQPMLFGGEPLYWGRYTTSTAVMMKLTKEGLTLDVASAFSNAASLNALTVATGRSYFGSATSATSTVHIGGSLATAISTKVANYTLTASDYTIIFDGTSLTATLPAASTCAGRIYVLVNRNATALTTSIAYQTLTTGVTSTTVTAASSIIIQSDGTNWYQIR
jgi:hypothetical protein